MLDVFELAELEESIRKELSENLTQILTRLNRTQQLDQALSLWGLDHLLHEDSGYESFKTGKIVVIGQSEVKANILLGVGKDCGIDKDRFELHLEYEDAKRFDASKMQYNPNYAVILCGPIPHSGKSKGDAGSIIAMMENTEGFPKVVRMGENQLKITKKGFRDVLVELIREGVIE